MRRLHMASPIGGPWPIGVTASVLPGDAQKCLQSGMSDVIRKPFTCHVLRRTLLKCVLRQTMDGLRTPSPMGRVRLSTGRVQWECSRACFGQFWPFCEQLFKSSGHWYKLSEMGL